MSAATAVRPEIPLFDVRRQHVPLRAEILAAWTRILDAGTFVSGEEVAAFEREFAAACQVGHCVAVGSGTAALELALRALGVGPGDRVLVPANTFFATAEAVSLVGAEPVFVDCEPGTRTISVPAVADALAARPAAGVIAVHLYGHPADVDALARVCEPHGAWVLEDACQAHLATLRGRRAGGLGRAACFSFYPSKNLGAPGEGGAVTTPDPELAEAVRRLRHHGQAELNRHLAVGVNARLGELAAAVLRIKLRRLPAWTRARRRVAARYGAALVGGPVTLPATAAWADPVWHLYVVEVADRDRVRERLRGQRIGTGVHYPRPVHLQPAYARLGHRAGTCPVAEAAAARVLSLPMYPELADADVDRVAEALLCATEGAC